MLFAYFKRILSLDDFGYEVLAAPKMYRRRVAKLVANRDPKTHTPPHPERSGGMPKARCDYALCSARRAHPIVDRRSIGDGVMRTLPLAVSAVVDRRP
jgi:hypothetical protein